jgi:hypothetical protein
MYGFEYNWLLSPVRTARGLSVRLARGGMMTLAVSAFCLTCALLPSGVLAPAAPATLAAPTAVVLKETAESELPRTLLRLWVLVPYLLPQR